MVKLQTEKAEAAGHGVKFFMKEQRMSRTAAENTVKARAFSDFVADSLETVFTKGDALGMLQRLKKADRGLVERMKAFVDKWISKLKKFYQGDHTITVEGQATAQLEKFQQAYSDAFDKNVHTPPAGYFGRPEEDIGRVLVRVVHPDFKYMTGETLTLEGGLGLRP
jgi:hypothetical protein